MGNYDSAQGNHDTDEFPVFISQRNTGELERRQQGFFQFMSGGHSFDPNDNDEIETDPTLPVVNPPK